MLITSITDRWLEREPSRGHRLAVWLWHDNGTAQVDQETCALIVTFCQSCTSYYRPLGVRRVANTPASGRWRTRGLPTGSRRSPIQLSPAAARARTPGETPLVRQ